VVIGTYPLLGIALRSGSVVRGPALSGNVRGLLFVCGVEIILFSLVFGLGWLASRASREELLFHWRPGWWVVPFGIGYSVAIRFALFAVVMVVAAILLTTRAATPETLQSFVSANRPNVETLVSVPAMRSNPSYFWLTLTLVSFVVAGLREEIWRAGTLAGLRALWPGRFSSRWGQCLAVTLIAVVFGAMHLGMGLIAAALAGVVGWLLGMIMILHKSVWPAVIAHGLFDATSMAVLPWAMERMQDLR
jgi:membrane protease YdiL (CAAX protease family)